jgi:signal transduction histidine kinase
MLEITGYDSSTMARFNDLFHSPPQFESLIEHLVAEKRVEGFKFLIRDRAGREDNWAVISVRYFEAQGFAEGVLLDISEQHSQMLELQRVNAELDNFTYHASHDLRAPLATIMGLANLGLLEGNSAEKQLLYFKMIQDRVDHLDALLKDLISVSFNKRSNTNYESIDLRAEIDYIIQAFELPQQSMRIVVEVEGSQPCATDPIRFRTIIRNIVSNAFKYAKPNHATSSIFICATISIESIQLVVQDNGIGIDDASKAHIYEMFFRGTTQSLGSGLGLYIVKSMVDKLKGEIYFESSAGEGTMFRVTIPNNHFAEL